MSFGTPVSLGQNHTASSTSVTMTLASSMSGTQNSILVACITSASGSFSGSCSDSKGNSYTLEKMQGGGSGGLTGALAVFLATNVSNLAASDTITVSFGGSSFLASIGACAVSGAGTAADQTASGSNLGTAMSTGNATITQATEILWGIFGTTSGASSTTWTAGTSYTVLNSYSDAIGFPQFAIEYQVVSSIAAYNASITSSVSEQWAGAMVTVPASAAQQHELGLLGVGA